MGNFEGRSYHLHFREPHCHLVPHVEGTPANICTKFICLETRIIDLHFATYIVGLLLSNFSGGLCNTILSAKVRFGR